MRRSVALAVLTALIGGVVPVAAAELSADYRKCLKSADTTADMSACAGAEVSRQDAKLGVEWKQTLAAMRQRVEETGADPSRRNKPPDALLLEGQRAWIQYKERACEFWAADEFGSLGRAVSAGECKAMIIAERIEWLQSVRAQLKADAP